MFKQAMPKWIKLLALYAAFVLIGLIVKQKSFKQFSYIWSDSEGYYMYLPAWFIYGNYSDSPVRTKAQFPRLENGNYYNKYSCGVALMQLPFFAIVHASNKIFKIDEANGYSWIYNYSILWAALSYCFIGLLILYNYLAKSYQRGIVLLTLASVFFGTNLFYYTYHEAGMSHAYSFCLVTFIVIEFIKKGKEILSTPNWLLYLAIGLLILVRPLNILILIYPLYILINAYGFMGFIKLVISKIKLILFALIPTLVLFGFNFYEWSRMKGVTTFYSYGDEGFIYWKSPKVFEVLFGIQNGLFVYSPVLLFGLFSLIYFCKGNKSYRAIILVLLILTYFFASWWAWWFGGAYGHRCYVDHLVLFAIPMAFLYSKYFSRESGRAKYFLLGIITILIFYSLRMTFLYDPPWDGPEWDMDRFLFYVKKAFYVLR